MVILKNEIKQVKKATIIWAVILSLLIIMMLPVYINMVEENNPLYNKAKKAGLIAGICLACSKVLEVYDDNLKTELPMLDDMNGHAGMKKYLEDGYEVISM